MQTKQKNTPKYLPRNTHAIYYYFKHKTFTY